LGQLLGGTVTLDPSGPRLLVEDGRVTPDLSCAALTVRRLAPAEGPPTIWGIGLTGPLGCFTGESAALRALVQAGDELAGIRSVQAR
jgi:hypothetical protein